MLMKQCKYNHRYDSEKFVVCPYCALEKVVRNMAQSNDAVRSLEDTEDISDET